MTTKTEAKHTSGPWEYEKDFTGTWYVTSPHSPNHDPIATVGKLAIANARLIAAAPELLEALEQLFEHCAMIHKHWGENSNDKQADAAIALGKAAIRKAKGE